MKIEIEKIPATSCGDAIEGSFAWLVRVDDLYEELDPSEALWTVACILSGQPAPGYLRTKEQHTAWEEKYWPKKPQPLEDHQKLLG